VLCGETLDKASSFNSQEIANTLNAMSKLDHYDKAVFNVLCGETLDKAGSFNSQDNANTLSGLCMAGHFDQSVFRSIVQETNPSEIALEGLGQFHQIQVCLGVEQAHWGFALPAALHTEVDRAVQEMTASVTSSALHMDVSRTLEGLGVGHANEKLVGGLLVDIVLVVPELDAPAAIPAHSCDSDARDGCDSDSHTGSMEKLVVIEVDGPSHYCANHKSRELGATKFKRRLLQGMGHTCVTVPYFEWVGSKQVKVEYLHSKLPGSVEAGVGGK
jgi:hypothetical protein